LFFVSASHDSYENPHVYVNIARNITTIPTTTVNVNTVLPAGNDSNKAIPSIPPIISNMLSPIEKVLNDQQGKKYRYNHNSYGKYISYEFKHLLSPLD